MLSLARNQEHTDKVKWGFWATLGPAKPNQTTLGEGPVTGQEVQFAVQFTNPLNLPADHFFFVPQVRLSNGDFFWLSAARPNVIDPFSPDLQAWVRNGDLDPDWLRSGHGHRWRRSGSDIQRDRARQFMENG